MEDDLFTPAPDACAYCGKTRAVHVGWAKGGPSHDYRDPEPAPRPDRVASAFIQTEWTCTHCGAHCDVWGCADGEWMECGQCGKESYLLAFASEP